MEGRTGHLTALALVSVALTSVHASAQINFDAAIPASAPTAENYTKPVAGDIDLDGDSDVLVVATTGGASRVIRVLRNDGLGNLSTMSEISLPGVDLALSVSDLDGDSHLDIIGLVGVNMPKTLMVWRGLGAGAFAAPLTLQISTEVFSSDQRPFILRDMDADGGPEVVVADASRISIVRIDAGTLRLAHALTITGGEFVGVARIDDDAYPDIVYSDSDDPAMMFRNGPGGPSAIAEEIPALPDRLRGLVERSAAGAPDLIVLSQDAGSRGGSGGACLLRTLARQTDGALAMSAALTGDLAYCPYFHPPMLKDMDGDGGLELVYSFLHELANPHEVLSGGLVSRRIRADGSFEPGPRFNPWLGSVVDLNGDGRLDALTVGGASLRFWRGTANANRVPLVADMVVGPDAAGVYRGEFPATDPDGNLLRFDLLSTPAAVIDEVSHNPFSVAFSVYGDLKRDETLRFRASDDAGGSVEFTVTLDAPRSQSGGGGIPGLLALVVLAAMVGRRWASGRV